MSPAVCSSHQSNEIQSNTSVDQAVRLLDVHSMGHPSQAAQILLRNRDVIAEPCPKVDTMADQSIIGEPKYSESKPTLMGDLLPGITTKLETLDEEAEIVSFRGFSSIHMGLRPVAVDMKVTGSTLDDLVDRLLSQPMSNLDSKFRTTFLCLYRKFATPSKLISAIIGRFERLKLEEHPQIQRLGVQLRYLGVLTQWMGDYPGDFAHHSTRQQIGAFIAVLRNSKVFAFAAEEMSIRLEFVSEDDDTEWACSDVTPRIEAAELEPFPNGFIFSSQKNCIPLDNSNEELDDSAREWDPKKVPLLRHSKTPSSSSSLGHPSKQSEYSLSKLLISEDVTSREAQLLTPVAKVPLTKVQWHAFMDNSEEDIACELTRIDWIMFSSIRPRDLVRHVSVSVDRKDYCKGLENVNRMIGQFQHVAFWVANLVLLREKPKHRAKALERFMSLAWVSQGSL